MLPTKKFGSARLSAGTMASDCANARQAGVGEHHALGDLGGERHHLLAQCGENNGRQCADAVIGFELVDKGAGIGQRLSHGDAEPLMRRAMGDADAKAKAPARDLVDIGRTRREFFGRLRIDWRDRGAEPDPLGSRTPMLCTAPCCRTGSAYKCPKSRAARSRARYRASAAAVPARQRG